MTATVLRLDQEEIQNVEEMKASAEAFLTGGYSTRLSEDEMEVSKFIVSPKDPRFSVERLEISPDPSRSDECVRYEFESRERDNPQWPGAIFEGHIFGMLCRLPGRADRLANLQLSERYELGKPADSLFFATLKAREGEAFLKSFRPASGCRNDDWFERTWHGAIGGIYRDYFIRRETQNEELPETDPPLITRKSARGELLRSGSIERPE